MGINAQKPEDSFAYDLSKNIISKGEIFDKDAINQSIENILSTLFGERVFRPFFGSRLPATLFEIVTAEEAEKLLDDLIDSIAIFEDRIEIFSEEAEINLRPDQNTLDISSDSLN